MEQDIKILEDYIELIKKGYCEDCNELCNIYGAPTYPAKKISEATEHLIKAYKELEEENKIIKGNYYTLCADIQMVTSELGFPEDTIIADEMVSMIKLNYIPVSLVEEKILNPMKEEHDKAIKGFIKRDIPQCIEDGGIAQELGYFIGKIEELLEKRK